MFNITKSQVLAAFNYRAACRYYDPTRKISKEDMDYILELARLSPSSVGSEPWQFFVLQNQVIRQKIAPVAWGIKHPIEEASHIVVLLAKKNARYKDFQTNDMKIADSERALFDWCCKQTYIALGNMMTGAALIGIDSCPIEGFNYDEVNRILSE